jgi:putative acetyltransferase
MSKTDDTPKIEIRAQCEADAAAVTRIRNAAQSRWGTLALPFEPEAYWRKRLAAPVEGQKELVACIGGEVVGMAGIHRQFGRRAHVADIGISVHDDWHGKGVGTALFTALTDLADNWLNISRLQLGVFCDNAPALALYKKFGFEIEGTERADVFRDGAYVDGYVMARLRGHLPADTAPYPPAPAPAPAGGFSLRAAEPGDAEAVAALMNQPIVRHGTLRAPYCSAAEMKHFVTREPPLRTVVAVVDGQAIGIAMFRPLAGRRGHVGEVEVMAVHDAWQGRGVGTALLAALLDVADNWLNLRRVVLGVLADNASAIKLYRRFGFETECVNKSDVFRAGAYADSMTMARARG